MDLHLAQISNSLPDARWRNKTPTKKCVFLSDFLRALCIYVYATTPNIGVSLHDHRNVTVFCIILVPAKMCSDMRMQCIINFVDTTRIRKKSGLMWYFIHSHWTLIWKKTKSNSAWFLFKFDYVFFFLQSQNRRQPKDWDNSKWTADHNIVLKKQFIG